MKKLFALFALLLTVPVSAFAAVDLTNFAVDVTAVESVVAIIIVGLGTMWGIRKLIKTVNRS